MGRLSRAMIDAGADLVVGKKIIDDLVERSHPFGTVVEWREREGIGVVRLR